MTWHGEYRKITADEADDARNNILESIERFPVETLARAHIDGMRYFTLPDIYGIAAVLRRATVVFWDVRLWDAAIKGADVFIGSKFESERLQPDIQLWIPDIDLVFNEEDAKRLRLRKSTVLTAVLLGRDLKLRNVHAVGIFSTPFEEDNFKRNEKGTFAKVYADRLELIENLPAFRFWEMPNDDEIIDHMLVAGFKALIEFMRQPFVEIQERRPDRAERRRLEKKNMKWPDIRQVILRKRVVVPADVQKSLDGKKVEWSCSWLVSGHWRNQYYSSTQEHRWRFIEGYVKGPADKPMKPPAKIVYAVKR